MTMKFDDLDWDLKTPCADCPFTKAAPFHEGVAQGLPGVLESIEAGNFSHTCHKTDRRPMCDGPQTWEGRTKHCAGAVLMLLKTGDGKDLQLPLLRAAEAGKLDLHDMTARAKADTKCWTVDGLMRFYLRGIRERMNARKARIKNARIKKRKKRNQVPLRCAESRREERAEP